MTPETEKRLAQWMADLRAEADKIGMADYIDGTDADVWRGYFEDGYTPKAALGEDLSYA